MVGADYAGFIDLPTIIAIPFWLGIVLNMLRWTVWQTFLRRLLAKRRAEAERRLSAAQEPATSS